ncbi:hypothetical protein FCI58_00605 [Enterobacter hormaechei]|nr:hypothetical protein [Enterobacter hormaechei]
MRSGQRPDESRVSFHGVSVAVHGSEVHCGCPPGSNRVIAPPGPCCIWWPLLDLNQRPSDYENGDNILPEHTLS